MTKNTVKYFNEAAGSYNDRYQDTVVGYGFRIRRQRIFEYFDKPGGKVLDVGCGSGVMVQQFLDNDCEYWGIDPAEGMIEEVNRVFGDNGKVHARVAGAAELPFEDNSFDAVVCAGVIERVEQEEKALGEMARVLKAGGTLIITYPNRYSPYVLWRFFVYYPLLTVVRPLHRVITGTSRSTVLGRSGRLYSSAKCKQAVEQAGFQPTDVVFLSYSFFFSPIDELIPRLAYRVTAWMERLHKTWLRGLGAAFMVKATRNESG